MQKLDRRSISQSIAFFNTVLETISGVILFLIWTRVAGIRLLYKGVFLPLLWAELATLLITFILNGVILFTPFSDFLSRTWKIFLAGFLSLVVLSLILIIPMKGGRYADLSRSSLSIVPLFVILVLILYITNYTREKEVLRMQRHKRILSNISNGEKAKKSWEAILRSQILGKWGLAECLFASLLIVLAFWGSFIFINRLKILPAYQGGMLLALLIFLMVISLIDLVKGSKWSKIPAR